MGVGLGVVGGGCKSTSGQPQGKFDGSPCARDCATKSRQYSLLLTSVAAKRKLQLVTWQFALMKAPLKIASSQTPYPVMLSDHPALSV